MNIGMSAINARIMICIISCLMPIVLLITTGTKLPSLSEYFYTPMGPFFVSVLTLTCYLMFTMPKWIPSAILLGVVIMFPNHEFGMIHNISAVMFFIMSALVILSEKRFRIIGWIMIMLSPISLIDLFSVELIMIILISVYHLKVLFAIKKILKST
jgi:hypothetical protein